MVKCSQSIVMHIRRGDYVENPISSAYQGVCPISYYHTAVELISKQIKNPEFFVFSDDIEWSKKHIKLPYETHFIESDSINQDIEEMHLMSQCRHYIIDNSSYSWWGAWLGEHAESIIIGPSKLLKDQKSDNDIVPERWVQL